MADIDAQVKRVRNLHFWAGINMLMFFCLMAIAYGAALQFRVFQLPTFILGTSFGPNAVPIYMSVGKVNTTVLVASFVLLTWIFHHIEAIWAERVVAWIRGGAQWLRWVEYSFSARCEGEQGRSAGEAEKEGSGVRRGGGFEEEGV